MATAFIEEVTTARRRGGTVGVLVADAALRQRAVEALMSDGVACRVLSPDDAELDPDNLLDMVILSAGRAVGRRVEDVRRLQRRLPDVGIIVVVPERNDDLQKTLQAGAWGIVVDADVEIALASAVDAVRSGLVVVPQRERLAVEPAVLSHRERQVLELVVLGMTNAEIASRLFLAESTVKSHLKSLFAKLDVRSRSQAAAVAAELVAGFAMTPASVMTVAERQPAPPEAARTAGVIRR